MKETLNSKCNDNPSKPFTIFLNRIANVYESLEEIKMLIAKKHLALVAQMHTENQSF